MKRPVMKRPVMKRAKERRRVVGGNKLWLAGAWDKLGASLNLSPSLGHRRRWDSWLEVLGTCGRWSKNRRLDRDRLLLGHGRSSGE